MLNYEGEIGHWILFKIAICSGRTWCSYFTCTKYVTVHTSGSLRSFLRPAYITLFPPLRILGGQCSLEAVVAVVVVAMQNFAIFRIHPPTHTRDGKRELQIAGKASTMVIWCDTTLSRSIIAIWTIYGPHAPTICTTAGIVFSIFLSLLSSLCTPYILSIPIFLVIHTHLRTTLV